MFKLWNLWHGCHKISEGCLHCYVYARDAMFNLDSSRVHKTKKFTLPVDRKRNGEYKVPPDTVLWTCFTSDFFLRDADSWRGEAWEMIRARPDVNFIMATKRVNRISCCLPGDWGGGYDNVTIYCTVESRRQAARRLPLFRELPIRHKGILCEPLLDAVSLRPWLGEWVELVIVGGESGSAARPCDFSWVLELRHECEESNVSFRFKQTGTHFIKDGKRYVIRRRDQMSQARKAGIDFSKRPPQAAYPKQNPLA